MSSLFSRLCRPIFDFEVSKNNKNGLCWQLVKSVRRYCLGFTIRDVTWPAVNKGLTLLWPWHFWPDLKGSMIFRPMQVCQYNFANRASSPTSLITSLPTSNSFYEFLERVHNSMTSQLQSGVGWIGLVRWTGKLMLLANLIGQTCSWRTCIGQKITVSIWRDVFDLSG